MSHEDYVSPEERASVRGGIAVLLVLIFGAIAFGFHAINAAHPYPNIKTENIHVATMPQDCDFATAPLGNKLCHYEKIESFVDREGQSVPTQTNAAQVFVTWKRVTEI
ncbi:MAG: hypothetical protein ACLQJF_06995 [Candidatus Sulfotelmatobacter sp.]|jgi:hypothetical protein